jgi:hypothetical protein
VERDEFWFADLFHDARLSTQTLSLEERGRLARLIRVPAPS